jgi:hypothetical protein
MRNGLVKNELQTAPKKMFLLGTLTVTISIWLNSDL